MNNDFVVKITDFGLSKTRAFANTKRTKTNAIVGSIAWAAPEYLDPNRKLERTEKGDIFSFAVILWELITREIPWKDLVDDDICDEVISGKRLNIPQNCNNMFTDIFTKCWNNGNSIHFSNTLHKDPTLRPSFKDLLDMLAKTVIESNAILVLVANTAKHKRIGNFLWNNTADAKQLFSVELVCPAKEKPSKYIKAFLLFLIFLEIRTNMYARWLLKTVSKTKTI